MLDIGLTKLAVIGVVALVVVGPERLPRVARTLGALVGRAQRYVNDVKAEVTREIELDSLKKMKSEFESAAHDVQNTIHTNLRKHESELNDAWRGALGGDGAPASMDAGAVGDAAVNPDGFLTDADLRTSRRATARFKRVNWRVKQAALPAWYKRANLKRTRVQSGAARVARHTPASLRRPTRFF